MQLTDQATGPNGPTIATTDDYHLSKEQLNQYETDGYIVLRQYFDSSTVNNLAAAADELTQVVGPLRPETPHIQVDLIDGEWKLRQVHPIIDISPVFAALSQDDRVIQPFESLFGERPVLFEDKINYKYPKQGSAFPMHQDYSYWKKYSPRLTSALIYIDEATEENGCLEVVPGWHRKPLLADPTKLGKEQHYIDPQVLDPSLAVKVPGGPGTMIIFSCMTPHASKPNYSDHRRRAVIMTYNPASDGDAYYQYFGYDDAESWAKARKAATSTNM